MNTTTNPSTLAVRPAWLLGGAVGLVGVGALAAAVLMKAPATGSGEPPPANTATAANTRTSGAAPAHSGTSSSTGSAGATSAGAAPRAAEAAPLATQPAAAAAPVCASCGVVQSVTAVYRKGEGTGLGAVAGGLLGGVVGHQMGGGRGKDAMTVLGAVGGGFAGNEIEKRQRATTEFRIKVRMDDGSLRTVTQAQSLPVGQPVRVDGHQLTPLAAAPAEAPREGPAPRMQQASTRS